MHSRRAFLRTVVAAGAASCVHSRLATVATGAAQGFRGRTAGETRAIERMTMCWCPPGEFMMGSPAGETGRRVDEAQVRVTLTRGFWTAKFEVTQRLWTAVMGGLPSRGPSAEFGLGEEFPVYWVSYPDAEAFCRRASTLATQGGSMPAGWAFALPTEAQWEYACRAGTTTATAFGDQLGRHQANFSGLPLNGGRDGGPVRRATPVGSYPANPWGLCDMHGNIFEWCRDWYHARLPGGTDPDLSNRIGEQNRDGTYSRVRRGGAWNDDGEFCRSALRLKYEPDRNSDHIGFRVVVVEA